MSQAKIDDATQLQLVMTYAAELELEVDRLRGRDQFLQHAARDHFRSVMRLCKNSEAHDPEGTLAAIKIEFGQFSDLLSDMSEPSGYHPAFDQVIAIAVRPLAEQVFRWQRRFHGAINAVLRLDLDPEHVEWFPARLAIFWIIFFQMHCVTAIRAKERFASDYPCDWLTKDIN